MRRTRFLVPAVAGILLAVSWLARTPVRESAPPAAPSAPQAAARPSDERTERIRQSKSRPFTGTLPGASIPKASASRESIVPPGPPIPSMPTGGVFLHKGEEVGFNGKEYVSGGRAGQCVFALRVPSPDPDQPYLHYMLEQITAGGALIAKGGPEVPRARDAEGDFVFSRPGVEEIYRPGPDGVEQSFLLRRLPEARGEVVVEGRLQTNLRLPEGKAPTLTLGREGRDLSRISDAVAIDARGRRLPLDLEIRDGRLLLRLAADWVRDAELPLVIDPLIGPVTSLTRNATNPTTRPVDIVYG